MKVLIHPVLSYQSRLVFWFRKYFLTTVISLVPNKHWVKRLVYLSVVADRVHPSRLAPSNRNMHYITELGSSQTAYVYVYLNINSLMITVTLQSPDCHPIDGRSRMERFASWMCG